MSSILTPDQALEVIETIKAKLPQTEWEKIEHTLAEIFHSHENQREPRRVMYKALKAVRKFWDETDTPKAYFIGDTCRDAIELVDSLQRD